jgi:hypothetical protein
MNSYKVPNSSPILSGISSAESAPSIELSSASPHPPKEQKRCGHADCKKKLAFSDFACRCGTRYCGTHKGFVEHACSFDYKADAKKTLDKQLLKCENDKIERL